MSLNEVNPNEVCLKDINPLIKDLRAKEEEAKQTGKGLMYFAYCEARHMIEDAPTVGAAEFVKQQTGKTIRELAEELPLYEIVELIDKLYYEYQIGR